MMANSPGTQEVCPYLGLYNDRECYWPTVSKDNRCYALGAMATSVDEAEQRTLCLGGGFPVCPRYLASQPRGGHTPAHAPRPPRGPFLGSPLSIVIGGGVALIVLLACTIGLIAYQSGGFSRLSPTPAGGPTQEAPVDVDVPTELPPDLLDQTPVVEDTPIPTLTFTPRVTATRQNPPTSGPTNTLVPTVGLPTATRPVATQPPAAPTARPTATRAPTVIYPTSTPRPTSTRYPTSTTGPTRTPSPTWTPSPTTTPTLLPYSIALSAGQTAAQIKAGQTASLDVSVENLANVSDSIVVQIFPALLAGWQAKLFVNGADQGAGPVTLEIGALSEATVTIRFTVPANAAVGDAGEVIVTATSQSAATATDTLTVSASVIK
jgi:hypothetical protein